MEPVHFFLDAEGAQLERLRELDPESEWSSMRGGIDYWITQTHAHLRAADLPVTLGAELPRRGIVVFYAAQKRELERRLDQHSDIVLVGVRADRRASAIADYEVLQARTLADEKRRFFVPHWPQPALIARDAARAERVERIAYKGFSVNSDPALISDTFRGWLAREGLEFDFDAVGYRDGAPVDGAHWNDYRCVDAVLALRPRAPNRWRHKPASKLCNAWLAGVPAVLSSDQPYLELRRSELDFLIADDAETAMRQLLRLKSEPKRYRAMVANGRERAREFGTVQVLARWRELLWERIPARLLADRLMRSGRVRSLARAARWISLTLSGERR
jgi:hypothetical protein